MSWRRTFRARLYVRDSLWVLPLAGALALRLIGTTELAIDTGVGERRPPRGVVIPARSWEDYLMLTVNEIRIYGDGGIQVMRRLRAMLEELYEEIRPEFRAAVKDELMRLQATVAQSFGESRLRSCQDRRQPGNWWPTHAAGGWQYGSLSEVSSFDLGDAPRPGVSFHEAR